MRAVVYDLILCWGVALAIFLFASFHDWLRLRPRLYRRNKKEMASLRAQIENAIAREQRLHAAYEGQLMHWRRLYDEMNLELRRVEEQASGADARIGGLKCQHTEL